jgi:hypothetical protein
MKENRSVKKRNENMLLLYLDPQIRLGTKTATAMHAVLDDVLQNQMPELGAIIDEKAHWLIKKRKEERQTSKKCFRSYSSSAL